MVVFSFPGYQIIQPVQTGIKNVIYRGIRKKDGVQVILKTLSAEFPSLEDITRLRHEYKITQNLNLENVVKSYALENVENNYALIMEDLGRTSLKQLLATQKLQLQEFLMIAIQLAIALEELHQHHIIHKDIKPSNILIDTTTKQLKIIDFSIATRLSRETPTASNPNEIEGTLAYLSPEQTGRMNRTLDYRTDFYSLGITYYEMLTNQLPFNSLDPLELVYSHLAKTPPSLQQKDSQIPKAVSEIVKKLLAKNAEDRYQSAQGLKVDLENCLSQLQATGQIISFVPGQRDQSGQFLLPQKLYGREREVTTLLTAFERVSGQLKENEQGSKGSSEIVLVSGYSGIGKTRVVQEVYKPIVKHRGYFISGKFDQLKRNIPYAAIIQAFQELVHQLLTETASQVATWKTSLLEALGVNAQVIIDVIPEIELIVGKQPEVPQLDPTATQNRFNLVFQQFIRVFTTESHPLVLFLDDLQWADLASLKLIQLLMTDSESQYFLLIGAYRDNEVSATHSLTLTIAELEKAGVRINPIILQALTLETVSEMISDTLKENKHSTELSRLIFNKTQGNPFFITQLLQTLYTESFLIFNFNQGQWQWNLEEIQGIGITDLNVVELVARNLQKLPEVTQEMLKLAACIGNTFYLDVLTIVSEKNQLTVAEYLWESLQSGLILPLSKAYKIPLCLNVEEQALSHNEEFRVGYKFLHDRVQQAAYSLIPESQKQATHLKIGRLLLQQTPKEVWEESLFDIVNQLNIGQELMEESAEKEQLASLNLKAGKKAKVATAYEAAVRYLTVGLELLPENSWHSHYNLTLELYLEAAEAEYLITHFNRAEDLVNLALTQTTHLLDSIRLYELQMQIDILQYQMVKAIDRGLEILEELGVFLAKLENDQSLIMAIPGLTDLDSLPEMTDPYKLSALRILKTICAPVFMAKPEIFPQLILTMVNLCVEQGYSELAAFAYGFYGLLLSGMGHLDAGYQAGLLALKLLQRFNANSLKAKVYNLFNANIRPWKEHARNSIVPFQEGLQSGLETGDVEWGAYCAANFCGYLLLTHDSLDYIIQQQQIYINILLKIKLQTCIHFANIWRQLALNFQGQAKDIFLLVGESFNEQEIIPLLKESKSGTGLFVFYVAKTIIFYHFQNYAEAIEQAALATEQAGSAFGFMQVALLNFYDSLALLAHYPTVSVAEQENFLARVKQNQQKMQTWAAHAPANYQHKYELVEAEKARVLGEILQAQDYYERAIQNAKHQGYLQEEALANELAGKFFLNIAREKIAKTYLTDAYYSYIRWGAVAKVKDLDEKYPNLIFRTIYPAAPPLDAIQITTTRTTHSTSTGSSTLDLAAVIKAAQALSGEFVLETLLRKLMIILMKNAGAHKGYLILHRQGNLVIEVSANCDEVEVIIVQPMALEPELIPLSVINYVIRTEKILVLNNTLERSKFMADPYFQQYQPQSVLCSPILNQGKLAGLLYLENNLAVNAFTQERTDVLNLLCLQAAISLENAFLYRNLEQANQQLAEYSQSLEIKVEERTAELKSAQKQLVINEKLAALGAITAGVAHELRNPLNFVNNFAESSVLLSEELMEEIEPHAQGIEPEDWENIKYLLEELKENAKDINHHGKRAENIIHSMMMHARTDSAQSQLTDLNALITQAIDLAYHSWRAKDCHFNIKIETDFDATIGQLDLVAADLSRAFINLIDNACHAVHTKKQKAGGSYMPTLSVQTKNRPETVEIWLEDNGVGIESTVKERIFEPFFTTKLTGEGTGLGLSLTHDIIVGQHQGSIQVETELTRGTKFIIVLPKNGSIAENL